MHVSLDSAEQASRWGGFENGKRPGRGNWIQPCTAIRSTLLMSFMKIKRGQRHASMRIMASTKWKENPQFPLRNLTGAPFHVLSLSKQPNGFFFIRHISHQTGHWLINSLCCCNQFILLADENHFIKQLLARCYIKLKKYYFFKKSTTPEKQTLRPNFINTRNVFSAIKLTCTTWISAARLSFYSPMETIMSPCYWIPPSLSFGRTSDCSSKGGHFQFVFFSSPISSS